MAKQSWGRRNELAREKGYSSYYDYRAHNYGRTPPGAPRASGEQLRALRGHSSRADFLRELRAGRVEIVSQVPGDRDPKTGQYKTVRLDVQLTNGDTRSYTLRGGQLKGRQIADLRSAVGAAGADVYTNPSLDVFGLADDDGRAEDREDFDLFEDDEDLEDVG